MSREKPENRGEPGEFGKYIANLRKEKGYSLRDVEQATGRKVSNAYLSQLEHGKIKKPSPNILYGLSNAYGVKYEDLMAQVGYAPTVSDTAQTVKEEVNQGFSIGQLTAEERAELVEYLDFLRSRKRSKK